MALAFWGSPMRTRVYVDGFNLYYALKRTPFKWLDPVKLTYQLLPAGHSVTKLKYFTARVSGIRDAGAPARQQVYLNALATLPEVEVLQGTFLSKSVWTGMLRAAQFPKNIPGSSISKPATW